MGLIIVTKKKETPHTHVAIQSNTGKANTVLKWIVKTNVVLFFVYFLQEHL